MFSHVDGECVNFLLHCSVRCQESARVGLESETNSSLVTSLCKQTSGNCNGYVPAVTTAFTHAASADPVSSYVQTPTERSAREKTPGTHHVTSPAVLPAHLFAFLQIILQQVSDLRDAAGVAIAVAVLMTHRAAAPVGAVVVYDYIARVIHAAVP